MSKRGVTIKKIKKKIDQGDFKTAANRLFVLRNIVSSVLDHSPLLRNLTEIWEELLKVRQALNRKNTKRAKELLLAIEEIDLESVEEDIDHLIVDLKLLRRRLV